MNHIPLKREQLTTISNAFIAEYGYKKEISRSDGKGNEETYRTDLRRQRDKILYLGGFRRLQDKTQVVSATLSGDHRTRLTHTLEVEQIAVSVANALRLNSDLASAIALGHDVGHTPFGHAAENKLDELLEDVGGFNHPIQSVAYIWEKYGRKIDEKIYEGILLHDADMFVIDKSKAEKQLEYLRTESKPDFGHYFNNFPSTLEAQVVFWADKIAYLTHDLEDFLNSRIFSNLKKSEKNSEDKLVELLKALIISKKINKLEDYESRDLIRNIITQLIESSAKIIEGMPDLKCSNIREKSLEKYEKIEGRKCSNKGKYMDSLIINFSTEYREAYNEMRKFLNVNYISSPEVQRNDAKAKLIVGNLFNVLIANDGLLPLNIKKDMRELENSFSKSVEKKEVQKRIIASYISTMSDTYAKDLYGNLIGSKDEFVL